MVGANPVEDQSLYVMEIVKRVKSIRKTMPDLKTWLNVDIKMDEISHLMKYRC